jgi:hypothetical protein
LAPQQLLQLLLLLLQERWRWQQQPPEPALVVPRFGAELVALRLRDCSQAIVLRSSSRRR